MRRFLACVILFGLTCPLAAQDKADPSGTWKWFLFAGRPNLLKLKVDGGKVTATMRMASEEKDVKLEDAVYKNGEVTFTRKIERGGNATELKFTCKRVGDDLQMKMQHGPQGSVSSIQATRVKDE